MSLNIVTRETRPMCFEISLDGRLDTETHKQMEGAVDLIFESTVKGVRVDLQNLEYISSMGLRAILMAAKRSKAQNATFVLARPQPQVKAVLDIANMLPSQTVFASVEEADCYFDKIQMKKISDADGSGPTE